MLSDCVLRKYTDEKKLFTQLFDILQMSQFILWLECWVETIKK